MKKQAVAQKQEKPEKKITLWKTKAEFLALFQRVAARYKWYLKKVNDEELLRTVPNGLSRCPVAAVLKVSTDHAAQMLAASGLPYTAPTLAVTKAVVKAADDKGETQLRKVLLRICKLDASA